jgi:hypothetical protein
MFSSGSRNITLVERFDKETSGPVRYGHATFLASDSATEAAMLIARELRRCVWELREDSSMLVGRHGTRAWTPGLARSSAGSRPAARDQSAQGPFCTVIAYAFGGLVLLACSGCGPTVVESDAFADENREWADRHVPPGSREKYVGAIERSRRAQEEWESGGPPEVLVESAGAKIAPGSMVDLRIDVIDEGSDTLLQSRDLRIRIVGVITWVGGHAPRLIDDVVGSQQYRWRDVQPQRPSCLHVDRKFDLCRLLDGQIGRLCAL